MRFSTARTTPSLVFNPIAVDPSCNPFTNTKTQTKRELRNATAPRKF